MIRACDLLRELCGTHAILGCGVPVMPAFGKFEYCRISCDVTLDWDDKAYMHLIHRERPSTKNAVDNILSRRGINGRAYLSDPDVFFLRRDNCQLNDTQKYSLAVLDALAGGVFLTSDDPGSYTAEMKEQYRLYRSLTKAENVRFFTDNGITAVYDLDDETTRRRLF
jgi:alpha-galactosidase